MEAGDPRFPEYPGWGLSASRVPSLPAPNPPPHASNFFLRPCPPGATGLSGAQSVPGALLPLPTPATLLETQLPRPSFPLGTLPVRAGERAAWRRGLGGLRGASGSERGPSPPGCGSGRCAEAAEQLQPPPPRRSTLAPCAMVTHSKFPAAGMSRPLDTSLRLKTFSSKSEYQLVVNAVRKLQESGFYWSTVTGGEANLLLSAEPAGTFLIRDSSDQRHFFTLSVKTQSGTKNLRIQCEGGSFSLQSDPRSTQPVPRFDCVLKLVHHYMPAAGAPSFSQPPAEPSSSPSSEVPEQPPAQPLSGNPPRRAYYIYSGGEKIPLVLSRPLSSNVATLQHLCRKTVNGHLDSYEKVTQLPGPIREFLDQYDAPL
uniref:Suppressor of cytokine signaling 3 n=1 Tax=Bos taurus TaxID=9913 RepID=A0AAF6YSP9_BOVIN